MSTRCRIGIENKDGTITSIYCHHDGYVEGGVGETLVRHYQDESKIRKLLELGDMSSLGIEPVENEKGWEMPNSSKGDWFTQWQEIHPENKCVIYKTRGEVAPARTVNSLEEYQKQTENCWGQFGYLFKDGKWFYFEYKDEPLKEVQF